MPQQDKTAHYTALFILIAGLSGAGLLIPRNNGWILLFAYFSAFFGYFWYCRWTLSFIELLIVGIGLRLLLFLNMPSLSDDIYRFIWDGQLLANGVSPYDFAPSALKNLGMNGINPELFEKLNSPEYYSVYPPLNQLIFWLSSLGSGWLVKTNIIRAILLFGDIASLFLMKSILKNHPSKRRLTALFFLNPLLILEVTGNLHFEGLVITFLLIGLYFWKKNRSALSGIGFGLAIATKLVPIIFLPALLFKRWFKNGFITSSVAFLIFIISFIPFISANTFLGMKSSVGLYFQSFEFNASVYFLAREVGFWLVGYNLIHVIGPMLSVATLLGIISLVIWGVYKKWAVEKILLFSLSVYLLLATTVHPWYILPLMVLGLLSDYRFPLVWSLMIFVTYFGYQKSGFELSAIWIVCEYVVVIATFLIENSKKHHASNL